jgi:hypothetical protein
MNFPLYNPNPGLSLSPSAANAPNVPASTPHQAWWGDTRAGSGGYIPADLDPNVYGQSAYNPFWEAPQDAWSPWDIATVNDMPVPGIVSVRAHRKHRLDIKPTVGADGATTTLLGFLPAEIEISCRMWTQRHLQQYENLVSSILQTLKIAMYGPAPQKGGAPSQRDQAAFTASHPALAVMGISSLCLERLEPPTLAEQPQVMRALFHFREFIPIANNQSPKTAKAAKAGFKTAQNNADAQAGLNLGKPAANVPSPPSQNPHALSPTGT